MDASIAFVIDRPWSVAGREALRLIAVRERKDAHTLRVTFKEVYGPSLTAFVDLPVLPASWLARHAESIARGGVRPFLDEPPPGAGAARIESVSPRAIVVNAGRRVEFLLDQPPEAIRMGFAMRAIDGFWPQWRATAELAAERGLLVRSTPARSRLLVLWNCRKPPLDDAQVRAALGLAVDRVALVRELMLGQGEVREGIFRPGLWFAKDMPASASDPAEALRVLRKRNWSVKDGTLVKNGKPLRFELLTVAGNSDRAGIADRLWRSWAALGIEVTVTAVAQDELVNLRLPEHRFDAALLGLDFETTWDQAPFWHSSQARRGLNFSGLADLTLDGLLEALRVEYDFEKVPVLARDVERRIVSFHPFLPLFSGGTPVVLRKDVLSAAAGIADLLESAERARDRTQKP